VVFVIKTSVRLSPEISRKLASEARRLGKISGETMTVSELIRACIEEKFPEVSAKAGKGDAPISELRRDVSRLGERCDLLARDVEKLVKTLSDLFPQLASREQVDAVTDGIAAVIRKLKGS
jgi:predicted nuclease with TOPRIM domain